MKNFHNFRCRLCSCCCCSFRLLLPFVVAAFIKFHLNANEKLPEVWKAPKRVAAKLYNFSFVFFFYFFAVKSHNLSFIFIPQWSSSWSKKKTRFPELKRFIKCFNACSSFICHKCTSMLIEEPTTQMGDLPRRWVLPTIPKIPARSMTNCIRCIPAVGCLSRCLLALRSFGSFGPHSLAMWVCSAAELMVFCWLSKQIEWRMTTGIGGICV